jgi:hypothetical protein
MSLAAGSKLGSYEIVALVGAGGMGEVYRARDTKLKRDVALKVLPEAFANDPARMARFQREAEVLASLNHPNIAHLYGIEERALVMELVEGETLPCPLPVETALNYARQIAEALEYAHEKGVVHRDLKPANIKITPEGVVKVLDFGLAKAIDDPVASTDPTNSPTLTLGATRVGMILGTAAYMSPEQASGHQADRRADIWSFGAVLYEMLAGKKAFAGESVSDTLATVLKLDPDWDAIPKDTPGAIRTLVRRCLTKDRKQRLQAIGEARIALANPGGTEVPLQAEARATTWVAWAAAPLFAIALGALAFVHFREKPPEAEVVRFEIGAPATVTSLLPLPNVSPDGRKVAFVAFSGTVMRLWVRSLATREARPLDVTFGSGGPLSLATLWSPDSRWLVFADAGKLNKIDVTGGPPLPVCDLDDDFIGGFWTRDNRIVFGTRTGLRQVAAAGGASVPLTTLDHSRGELLHGFPSLLADGRHFLYTSQSASSLSISLYLGSLDAKPDAQSKKVVLAGAGLAVYAPSPEGNGTLLFVRPANLQSGQPSGTLMAQPFDARKLELAGEAVPVPVAEQVESFTVSATGALVYQTTTPRAGIRESNLNWHDRKGTVTGMAAEPDAYGTSVLSPDATRLAYARLGGGPGRNDVWLHDFASGVRTQFTFGPGADFPVWSPDGSKIVFSRNAGTGREWGLYRKASNGAGDETLLLKWPRPLRPTSWSRDGFLLFDSPSDDPKKGDDVWALPMDGPDGGKDNAPRKPILIISTASNDRNATFSPNGKWIAYTSGASGPGGVGGAVYVRPFDPASPEKTASPEQHLVTPEDTIRVYWRGNELLYTTMDRNVMAVAVDTTTPVFKVVAAAKSIFKLPAGQVLRDVTADGKRFLVSVPVGGDASTPQATPYSVVLNWTALLKK